MNDRFINPYTFVPLPQAIDRRPPVGHDRLHADRYAGTLRVRLSARSPLMVRGWGTAEEPEPPSRPGRDGGREQMIPGSSLHGAIRSLHEALVGGCLRVLADLDMVPFYRDPVVPGVGSRRQLAVVTAVDGEGTGRPTGMRLCDRVVRIRHDALHTRLSRLGADLPAAIATGERFAWTGPVGDTGASRIDDAKALGDLRPDPDGRWVLLVRSWIGENDGGGNPQKYTHTLGRLSGSVIRGVTDEAWDTYRKAIDGTDDWRNASRDGTPHVGEGIVRTGVTVNRMTVAYRHADRPWLHVDQVVWVTPPKADQGEASDLVLAVAWRHPGRKPLGERIGGFAPCVDAESLCPSCRMFGSVDPSGSGRDSGGGHRAEQRAYRGHVRIGDGVAVGKPAITTLDLAPLMPPRPASGQFYLVNPSPRPTGPTPAREWGSPADDPVPRPIRGRKFYWHTAPRTDGNERSRRRGGHTDKTTTRGAVFAAGTAFTFDVHFENLSGPELGSLLVALQPHRLWPGDTPHGAAPAQCISVGGGKPFGFGSCTAEVTLDRSDTARSRYLGESAPGGGEEFLARAVAEFIDSAGPRMRAVWKAARVVLRPLDQARSDLVWYPPGAGWDRIGSEDFDRGYEFWKRSQGLAGKDTTYQLVPLPLPTDGDLSLPTRPSATEHRRQASGGSKRGTSGKSNGRPTSGGGRTPGRDTQRRDR